MTLLTKIIIKAMLPIHSFLILLHSLQWIQNSSGIYYFKRKGGERQPKIKISCKADIFAQTEQRRVRASRPFLWSSAEFGFPADSYCLYTESPYLCCLCVEFLILPGRSFELCFFSERQRHEIIKEPRLSEIYETTSRSLDFWSNF